jgi:hypothetical protein
LTETTDTLQIAAQLYSWTYMASDLESTFKTAEASLQAAIQKRTQQLDAEEATISDQRLRYQTERLIAFYDELCSDKVEPQYFFFLLGCNFTTSSSPGKLRK